MRCNNVFTIWLTYTLISFFLYDIFWVLADWADFIQSATDNYMAFVYDFALCGIFALTSGIADRWLFKHKHFKLNERKRFNIAGIIVILLNLTIAACCEVAMHLLAPIYDLDDIWGSSFLFGFIASLIALLRLSTFYADSIIQKGQENLALQKKYIKLQLDPHFVFNSFSSLAGMIEVAPKMAEEYVVKMSQIYRFILHQIDKDYISITDGIEMVQAYVQLLNMRYNNNITLKIGNLNIQKHECILALSLQLLIENAVKHNTPHDGHKLLIEIARNQNMLTIRNNRIFPNANREQAIESYKIGINNLKQRYQLECDTQPQFIAGDNAFEVRLPIIKKSTE